MVLIPSSMKKFVLHFYSIVEKRLQEKGRVPTRRSTGENEMLKGTALEMDADENAWERRSPVLSGRPPCGQVQGKGNNRSVRPQGCNPRGPRIWLPKLP